MKPQDSPIAMEAVRIVQSQEPRRLGPKQIAWIEAEIPNVKYCATAVAARDTSVAQARRLAHGR